MRREKGRGQICCFFPPSHSLFNVFYVGFYTNRGEGPDWTGMQPHTRPDRLDRWWMKECLEKEASEQNQR